MHETWGFRAARAATFAAVCVLLAALGHVLMSGAALPWWAVPMAFGWMGLTAWIVADRERGVPFVVFGTLGAQAALHIVFTLAQTMTPVQHDHQMSTSSYGMHGMPMVHASSYGMLAAHVAAALLCGLWLAYGERAAFGVLRSVADRILLHLQLLTRPLPTPHQPRIRPAHSPTPYREPLLAHTITSRGPPRGTAPF